MTIQMSSVVSATSESDTCESENIQYGENNHIEYKWSKIQQEQILQLSFQLVRTTDVDKRHELAKKFITCFLDCSHTCPGVGGIGYEHAKTACKYRDSDS